MTYERFCELLGGFGGARIAVLGDMFLDKWLTIDRGLDEVSLETDLVAYQVVEKRVYPGAAGTVINNLAALGVGEIFAVGFIGEDGEGYEFKREVEKLGVDTTYLMKSGARLTPTYTKPMMRQNGDEAESNRLDFKNVGPTPHDIEDHIIESLEQLAGRVDAVMVVDQLDDEGTGAITARVRDALADFSKRHADVLVYCDSRSFIGKFRDVVVKCNDKEVQRMVLGRETDPYDFEEVKRCHVALSEKAGHSAFVTCGPRGVLAIEDGRSVLVPTVAQSGEIDIVGAGDATSAGIVSALCVRASQKEAALCGNLCASITIQVIGTTGTASPAQMRARFMEYYPSGEVSL